LTATFTFNQFLFRTGFYHVSALNTEQAPDTDGRNFSSVLAKVQLLPLPEEAMASSMREIDYELYKEYRGVPFVFVSPRRLQRHAYAVCSFDGDGVTVVEKGVLLYLRRK
jgi:hypothetical protein